ncbi:MAG: sodium:solute symporter, partial [Bacteroidetes bacterium]|nr:sodium:solute symporter [Bacteroidota bacterium]
TQAASIAGKMGRMNIVDWEFDPTSKYNIWSGLIGGMFLSLSYFGTDQSQVQRYLGNQPISQSRIGLLFNGIVKIPMQFAILAIGVLMYVFFSFNPNQNLVYYNEAATAQAIEIAKAENDHDYLVELETVSTSYSELQQDKSKELAQFLGNEKDEDFIKTAREIEAKSKALRTQYAKLIQQKVSSAEKNDVNYVFLWFVLNNFPVGLIGVLLACILFASMSSTSAELNALASTTLIDIYRKIFKKEGTEKHYLKMSKVFTAIWGVYAILFALFAGELNSLIEAVNVLGSLFYGTILGVFVVGFFLKHVKGNAVFAAAIVAQTIVCFAYAYEWVAYLWLTAIGCGLVLLFALMAQPIISFIAPKSK